MSGSPYWLLPTVLGLSEAGDREFSPQRLDEYKAKIPGGYEAASPADLPDVVGLKEIPWVFGRKYMDTYQWRVRRTFAPEDATVSGSPLWLLETVLDDAKQRGRVDRPGGHRPDPCGRARADQAPRPEAVDRAEVGPGTSAGAAHVHTWGEHRRRGRRLRQGTPRSRVRAERSTQAVGSADVAGGRENH